MNTKIIFLDIDDVLVDHTTHLAAKHHDFVGQETWLSPTTPCMTALDPVGIGILNALVAATDAKVVLCSTWRNHFTFEVLDQHFSSFGADWEWGTPWKTPKGTGRRELEIQAYLDQNDVFKYVWIDDIRSKTHNNIWVRDGRLTIRHYEKALTYLKGGANERS